MEHRDKRPRLENEDSPMSNREANTPSTEPSSAAAAMRDGSLATASSTAKAASESVQDTSTPLTPDPIKTPDKAAWQGWAEIENDPVVFNVMLREWGVQGIQVNEVVPLDAIFDSSPASTYGLIFLSRYSSTKKDQKNLRIPQDLWFANQTSTFSCASVALMNILSNVENVNLGPEVSQFVTATSDMSSKDRGLALDSFEHVRKVHNSFATIIDMKSVDHRLQEDAKAFAQRQNQLAQKPLAPKPTKATNQTAKKNQKAKKYILDNDNQNNNDAAENGFHFIAYMPAHNHLWRMDGLQREPESLGSLSAAANDDNNNSNSNNNEGDSGSGGNWLDMAVSELSAQWQSAAENNIEFSLLSLVASSEDEAARVEENVKAARLREDWGPALAELVKIVAERVDT